MCTIWRDIRIGPGGMEDYATLARFHYVAGRPRCVSRVLAARAGDAVAGVIVETFPILNCAARNVALPGRYAGDRRAAANKLNGELRTIARLVVHPQFRGMGLAPALIRELLAMATTPFIEALAAMGQYHPMFERAGMRRFDVPANPEARRLQRRLLELGIGPEDLVTLRATDIRGELRHMLRKYARNKNRGPQAWLQKARGALLVRRSYYLWNSDDHP